jgi:hypothetical protein
LKEHWQLLLMAVWPAAVLPLLVAVVAAAAAYAVSCCAVTLPPHVLTLRCALSTQLLLLSLLYAPLATPKSAPAATCTELLFTAPEVMQPAGLIGG